MQLSFSFDRFILPAGVVAERILKYHQDDKAACELATVFIKQLQLLKLEEIITFKAYKLNYNFLLSLGNKYYLEDK